MNFLELGNITDASAFSSGAKKKVKLTVQRSGRGGFSSEAGRVLGLQDGMAMLVVVSGVDWFVKVVKDDPRGFRLRGRNGYFSADLKEFLRSVGVDFEDKANTTIYDISRHGEDESDGAVIWKFTQRVLPAAKGVAGAEPMEKGEEDTQT